MVNRLTMLDDDPVRKGYPIETIHWYLEESLLFSLTGSSKYSKAHIAYTSF